MFKLFQRDLSRNFNAKAEHSGTLAVENPHPQSFPPNHLSDCQVSSGLSSVTWMFLEYFLLSELLRKKEAISNSYQSLYWRWLFKDLCSFCLSSSHFIYLAGWKQSWEQVIFIYFGPTKRLFFFQSEAKVDNISQCQNNMKFQQGNFSGTFNAQHQLNCVPFYVAFCGLL